MATSQTINVHLSGKVISACFALASFAVAILAGLASDNPASSILGRALLAMIFCYPLGMIVGMVCERLIIAHIDAHQRAHPAGIEAVRSEAPAHEPNANDEEVIVV